MRMEDRCLDALAQARRMSSLLNETLDLTRQLAEAIDRNDQVSVRMVIAMREEPIRKATLVDRAIKEQRDQLSDPDERSWFSGLLVGRAGPDDGPQARALAERMALNGKTLQQIKDLDQVLSRKLSRGKSGA